MFSGRIDSTQDEQRAYLIDQNPKYFEPILDYLRNKKLIIDPNVSLEGVLAEAQFFQIQSLIHLLEENTKEKDS